MAPQISRRTFLKRSLGLGMGISMSAALGFGYTRYGEPTWLAVEHIDVPIDNLPPALEGLTIAHMSDIHLSPDVQPEHVAQAVALANAQKPDLVALTGDLVTYGRQYIEPVAELVSDLRAPLGVFAVLGNHDYWAGAPRAIMAAFGRHHIRTFRNESQRISVGAESFWLVGVDDVWEERNNLPQAFHDVPAASTKIALVHEPDIADELARYGVALQLSGHSHGGQVRLPFVGAPILPRLGRRYPIGLQRVPDSATQVYTTRGVGLVTPAYRFNCRPDVTVLRLTQDSQPPA
jgi:predicted MPP superfamily phosphohydrolase